LQNPESEAAKKKDEADRLRAAEKFMKVGTGEAFCRGCGYEYKPGKGDPEYPISAGTYFTVSLPAKKKCWAPGDPENPISAGTYFTVR
jgi:rubredoxin